MNMSETRLLVGLQQLVESAHLSSGCRFVQNHCKWQGLNFIKNMPTYGTKTKGRQLFSIKLNFLQNNIVNRFDRANSDATFTDYLTDD